MAKNKAKATKAKEYQVTWKKRERDNEYNCRLYLCFTVGLLLGIILVLLNG